MPRSTEARAAAHSGFDREAARARILRAALFHVPFDGWTAEVLRQGAVEAGLPPETALRVFPGGGIEAVAFWSALADRQMTDALAARDPASLKVRERVTLAVRLRLEAQAGHREALRRALGLLALPHHAGRGAALLWRTVDAIWYAAGDTATDFNFYTKRGLLAGVYGATVLFWLEDRSEGFADTWAFLDRRIADALAVPKALAGIGQRFAHLPNPLTVLRRFGAARR
ncbi:MAG: COQ9 family protein [Rhodospirillales bacterium]|nr:COQ9 family protein [Rhodospirillales bacterium]